jgi:hypothetical protein
LARRVPRPNDWDGFGQRFTGSGTVSFTDVAIGPEDYFGTGVRPRRAPLPGDVLPHPAQRDDRRHKAKVVIDELANRASSELFDVGGGSLVRRGAHLDRHRRTIRSIAAHNPKTLKAVAVGRHELNGTPLPNQGFF